MEKILAYDPVGYGLAGGSSGTSREDRGPLAGPVGSGESAGPAEPPKLFAGF
ncbi:hypothetical protein [Arthrobacter sp. 08Y14]|uniref:hypothetical protein n=1 Tax=Arthrobacter sp. 08Y14 TaxID=2058885 RepID=UPI0015E301A3|nr:hypothetical protein [Arthrobacter sp. 08Y14]